MTTLEERAPAGFFLSPTEREALTDLLAKAERLSRELSDAYREAQRIVTATTDLDPTVDLGDPSPLFRLQSGMVGYETTYADQVAVGTGCRPATATPTGGRSPTCRRPPTAPSAWS